MTVEQATAIARWKRQPYTPTEEASVVLADEVERLWGELDQWSKTSVEVIALARFSKVELDRMQVVGRQWEEAFSRSLDDVSKLRAELDQRQEERKKLSDECLHALSGITCTPAEGYISAGMGWIASDIRSLVGLYKKSEAEVERLRGLITECLDENGHLADGDICTLSALKKAVPEWEIRDDE